MILAMRDVLVDKNLVSSGAPKFAKVPPALPIGLGGTAVAQPQDVSQFYGQRFDPSKIGTDPSLGVSQPLQQTFVPPQAPTADQIRLAGGVDAFVKSQLPTGTEQRTTGLQDLPVGVSIEADGQFTGTGGLGAVQPVRTSTPIVKRDFLDPNMSMSRREVLSDPARFTGPTAAGIGPISEDASTQLGLAQDFNKFADRRDFIPVPKVQPFVSPAIDQTEAMLGGTGASGTLPQVGATAPQPVTAFTPLGRPSDISRLMPTTADIQAQQAAEARKAREEQERMIYEESQKRMSERMMPVKTDDQPDTPRLKDLKQRAQTRDAAKKSRQMSQARSEVIRSGGSAFEADAAAQAVFLDQSDEIRRERRLSERVSPEQAAKQGGYQFRTLTDVLEEEERESSGGGGGAPATGDRDSGDKSIVCTEIYRQTQLADWSKAMRVWDTYQRRYLTPEHEIGYHWLFKPYVSGMKKSNLLTRFGALMAGRRTQHLKHVLTKGKAKDDLFGNVFCKIIHPTVYMAGKIKNFLDGKTKQGLLIHAHAKTKTQSVSKKTRRSCKHFSKPKSKVENLLKRSKRYLTLKRERKQTKRIRLFQKKSSLLRKDTVICEDTWQTKIRRLRKESRLLKISCQKLLKMSWYYPSLKMK